MGLTLAALESLMPEMVDWAMQGYPKEACGLILERDGALDVLCCENLQDKLHAMDSERYPRTAETAYNLDPMVLYRASEDGAAVRGIFHSHPDRGAYFSDEDVLSALGGDPEGEPILPGVDYLVLSARADGVDDAKLFVWDEAERRFVERG